MMLKHKKMIIGYAVIIFLASSALWFYGEQSNTQQVSAQAEKSLDSGVALFKQKKYSEALEVFERVPSDTPSGWWARYYQGSTHIMLKDYQAGITYLEQALALNPTETRIMHALGVAYFKLGNLKLSKAYFASVLEIDPNDAEAKGLMDIMANLENQQSGETHAEPEPAPEKEPGQQ